jgi:membrane-associated phospholipid phosphatase
MALHVGLVPDVLVLVLAGGALVAGRPLLFVRDWDAFLLVVVLWQQTGPLAHWLGLPLHMSDLVRLDRWLAWPLLHGQLPQEWLQQHLYHPALLRRTQYHPGYWAGSVYHPAWWDHMTVRPVQWQWYDILSAVLYGLHFPEPLVVGFIIWLRDRALFRRFAAAFLLLAGLAFVGYVLYPAVPPWMASLATFDGHAYGAFAPPLHKIFDDFNYYVQQVTLGHRYFSLLSVSYDRTAAMPSLHAAFPVLSAFYLGKSIGRWGWLMLVYAGAMWFAVVYMGEHWVSDVLVGIVCAVLAYALVEAVARIRVGRAFELASSTPRPRPSGPKPQPR